jgi:F420-0:gamma-glutamyl ligase-like protein
MSPIDNLLALSTELSKLGTDLTAVGAKLAAAAAKLQEESANIAEEMSRHWGVDVSVNVSTRPGGANKDEMSVVKR